MWMWCSSEWLWVLDWIISLWKVLVLSCLILSELIWFDLILPIKVETAADPRAKSDKNQVRPTQVTFILLLFVQLVLSRIPHGEQQRTRFCRTFLPRELEKSIQYVSLVLYLASPFPAVRWRPGQNTEEGGDSPDGSDLTGSSILSLRWSRRWKLRRARRERRGILLELSQMWSV